MTLRPFGRRVALEAGEHCQTRPVISCRSVMLLESLGVVPQNQGGGEGGIRTLGSLFGYWRKRNAPYDRYPRARNFAKKNEPFSGPLWLHKYETILFRNKETPACAGGNHPDRPGSIHPNLCAKHYHY